MSPKISDEQKEQRKQQIFAAAERVFIRKGYEQATLKDIVEEAEMSRGWIYLYFQSKEEIFQGYMERMDAENGRALHELLETSPTVWAAVEALFTKQIMDITELPNSVAPAYYEYFIAGWRESERRAILTRRYDQSIADLEEMFEQGVTRGEFAPNMPLSLLARMAASQLEGIMAHALAIGAEHIEVPQQIDALLAFLKHSLGVRA
ncbi:TetR family transcriptional regulator [Brevibacillus fluminis]|uniref:TetR family transcriptional regulator n=1 Tax=Brevibacillus fluminis TaxID=511487 RepID=UPI003F8C06BC